MISNNDLRIIFQVHYDNNPTAYNQAFKDAGFDVPSDVKGARTYVLSNMLRLYFSNPSLLEAIMGNVSWNENANNYTTQNDLKGKIQSYLASNIPNPNTSPVGKFDWSSIQGLLFGNHQTVTQQTTVTPVQSSASTLAIVGYSVLGIMVVVLVIFLIRK